MPEQHDGEHIGDIPETFGLTKLDANAHYLSLAVYLMSNNMLGLEYRIKIIDYLDNHIDSRVVEALLSSKTLTISAFGENLWEAAIEARNTNIIKAILRIGVKADHRFGYFRCTAIQYAIRKGYIELIGILLNAGADVNAPAGVQYGKTALQEAVEKRDTELVGILLNAGADVNAPAASADGRTALQAAVETGDIELVRILLNAGADVNAPADGIFRMTALQAAAEKGNIDVRRRVV